MIRSLTYIFLFCIVGPLTVQAQLVLDVQKISKVEGQLSRDKLREDDKFGRSAVALGDLNGDGVNDLAVGAIGGSGFKESKGSVWILFMNELGFVKGTRKITGLEADMLAEVEAGSQFGSAVANLGDLDGDGVTEIAVGASGDDGEGTDRGAIWILFLRNDGSVKQSQKISSGIGGFPAELEDHDRFGSSIQSIGDLNGDGTAELLVGADGTVDASNRGGNTRVRKPGSAWVLFLTNLGTVGNATKIENQSAGFSGQISDEDGFGASVEVLRRADNSGQALVAIGSPGDDDAVPPSNQSPNSGSIWILSLNETGSVDSTIKISNQSGLPNGMELPRRGQFGSSLALVGDVNGDGISDLAVGAALDDDGPLERRIDADRGAVWILYLNEDFSIKEVSKISDRLDSVIRLDDNDYFGISMAVPGDIDGDGNMDLIVGASKDDDGGTNRGGLWVLFLNEEGEVESYNRITDTLGGLSAEIEEEDNFGQSVTAIGDLDGDGITDLAVGAENDDDGGRNYGAVWLLFMNPDGTVKSHRKISALETTFTGTEQVLDRDDKFGYSVAHLGDLDKDGVPDIAVGALFDDDGGRDRGAVWVFLMERDGSIKHVQKISSMNEALGATLSDRDEFGRSLASPGDLDGDSINDLVAGSSKNDGGGAIWFLFLNEDGSLKDFKKVSNLVNTPAGFELSNNDQFGESIESIGDINDDGYPDIAVGAVGDDTGGADYGAVWLFFLGENASIDSFKKIGSGENGFTGELDGGDKFGSSIAALGDINRDGVEDLAIGALADDDGGGPGEITADYGAVWVLNLNEDGSVKAHSKISEESGENKFSGLINSKDFFGISLAPLGDLNNDGIPDFVAGAAGDDDGGSSTGAVWVIFLNEAPFIDVLSSDVLQEAEAASELSISAMISTQGDVSNAILSYRKAGFSDFTSVLMNEAGGGEFVGSVPAFVTDSESSIEYYVTATDESGASTRSPEEGVFSIPIRIQDPGIELSYPAANYYRVVSFSLNSDRTEPSFIFSELGIYDDTRWRLFELSPSIEPTEEDLIEGGEISGIYPGKGYYIRSSEAFATQTGAGVTARTDTYFEIPLSIGWQLIGNPFSFDVPLDRLRLSSSGQSPSLNALSSTGWGPSDRFSADQGYAVFSDVSDTLLIAPNEFALNQLLQRVSRSPKRASAPSWNIDIEAATANAKDLHTQIQIFDSEKEVLNVWDPYDRPEAPPIGDFVSMYFKHDTWEHPVKKYSVDARPIPESKEVWPIEIITSEPDKVTLTVNGLDTVPAEYEVTLFDELLQSSVNLREENHYELLTAGYTRPRALSLVITPSEDADTDTQRDIPLEFEIYPNFPNPFTSWTTLSYALAEDTTVDVWVYNMLGQRVASLESSKRKKAGVHRLVWDGKADSGDVLASGIYIVRIFTEGDVLSNTITKVK